MRAWYALLGAVAAGVALLAGSRGWETVTGCAALSAIVLLLYAVLAPR